MPISLLAIGLSLLPNIGGIINGKITKVQKAEWYEKKVSKPKWRPPEWLFPPVWTTLYTSMGFASYLIFRDSTGPTRNFALTIYAIQLCLNWAWPPMFFIFHKMGFASINISVLWSLVAYTIKTFYPINKTAAYLLFPYIGWLSYATVLQYNVYFRNRNRKIQ